MSLIALASVELQLIMHHLSTPELLHLAQCSRFTLATASAPFAWQFATPSPLKIEVGEGGDNEQLRAIQRSPGAIHSFGCRVEDREE